MRFAPQMHFLVSIQLGTSLVRASTPEDITTEARIGTRLVSLLLKWIEEDSSYG